MRIFKHRIFLSLLAGKFTTIEQMLLTDKLLLLTYKHKWRMRNYSAHIFFGGKVENV